jgi:SAM-dependent methyltransferase
MSTDALKKVRLLEAEGVAELLNKHAPPPCRLLEVGAGAGWQAEFLSSLGYAVRALDLPSNPYADVRSFPVEVWEGGSLPVEDHAVDVLFTSNVLEHVENHERFFSEVERVLRPGGICIHVVPSATWRVFSNLGYWMYLLKRLAARVAGESSPQSSATERQDRGRWNMWRLMERFVPRRDGVRGNALTEILLFSQRGWRRLFQAHGMEVLERRGAGVFYTAYYLLGERLGSAGRKRLAKMLGSSCHVFVVRPGSSGTATRRDEVDHSPRQIGEDGLKRGPAA